MSKSHLGEFYRCPVSQGGRGAKSLNRSARKGQVGTVLFSEYQGRLLRSAMPWSQGHHLPGKRLRWLARALGKSRRQLCREDLHPSKDWDRHTEVQTRKLLAAPLSRVRGLLTALTAEDTALRASRPQSGPAEQEPAEGAGSCFTELWLHARSLGFPRSHTLLPSPLRALV